MMSALTWSPDTIWVLMQKAWWFLVVLGVLVAFHELGHFLAARWVGVKVLKFSLGFGPKLFGRQVGETEYLVSAVPLGGYVKLFGEDETEAATPDDRRRSFAHQHLWGKVLIVAAGPGFNFILAYLIFAGWLSTGAPLFVPTFRDLSADVEALVPGSPAANAGVEIGDRIVKVNGKDISTKTELLDAVAKSKGQPITLEVRREGQAKPFTVTPIPAPGEAAAGEEVLYTIGVEETPPLVTSVMHGSPASAAGFQPGDRVVAIEGQPIYTWAQMTTHVKDHPLKPLRVEVLRNGQRVPLTVTPTAEKVTVNGQTVEVGKIGISGPGRSLMRSDNPLEAVYHGLEATWGWTELTTIGLYKMIVGDISSKNIGGPLTIANISGEAASQGASSVVFLIAILSINLGVLNLLPIPILDGGHLLFFLIEGILRKPLGERQRELAQQVGLVLLVGVMIFAFWNDLERIFYR
ncbi:RIP metalloprotease RseP [Nitrospira moscoviensis]|uniref:Zinc metalloprotease n=1 Tax=Nitrospira moscoviensis TaxID=42253 RepID=A0A0K2GA62_NITMO|nr:RIP metalloprotease RseP [Nitrospira moscoviensis]ALA57835.1 Peptidase M50 [Nitrospira moscoviensis]